MIFSVEGYSHRAVWCIFFTKTLFRKKNQNTYAAKIILKGTEILKKNQRVLRVTPEERNCAKHKIATPLMSAQNVKALIYTTSCSELPALCEEKTVLNQRRMA